jgi:hypothetical protein
MGWNGVWCARRDSNTFCERVFNITLFGNLEALSDVLICDDFNIDLNTRLVLL